MRPTSRAPAPGTRLVALASAPPLRFDRQAMIWEPALYEKFGAERGLPFHDLLAPVEPVTEMDVVDLGCGTGELTRHMHAHLRARSTLGLDASPTMLASTCPPGQEPQPLTPAVLAADGPAL